MDRRRLALLFVAIGAIAMVAVYWLRAPRESIEDIRASFGPDQRGVFELLVVLGGLDGDGHSDWGRAEQACRTLGWPRCDRLALEQMQSSSRPQADRKQLQSAVVNLTWAFGSVESVKAVASAELTRLGESDGPARARVLLRFGIVDTNPDGQAALFNQACVADPSICVDPETTKRAAERETRTRRVPPGNVLPLYFSGGHPQAP